MSKSRAELRAAAEQHPAGQLLRVQQTLIEGELAFLNNQKHVIETRIWALDDKLADLRDRFYYLTLCLERPDDLEYSDKGYYRYQRIKDLYSTSKENLKRIGKQLNLQVPKDPHDEAFLNEIINAEYTLYHQPSTEVNNPDPN